MGKDAVVDLMNQRAVPLAGGVSMPILGLGTWQATGTRCYQAVRHALQAGYRHIDTATMYRNESQVGRALRDSGVPRHEVFLTTKMPPGQAGREQQTITASLTALGTDHVDLWLIHWPPSGRAGVDSWRRFLDARRQGLARAVGVSNHSLAQIDELIAATGQAPAVNQIPWSPSQHDPALLAALRARGVVVEGYSPFRGTDLHHPVLRDVASAHGLTPAQVVLRWHLQHGIVAIPKSVHPDRINENLDVFGFSLTDQEVARIDAMAAG